MRFRKIGIYLIATLLFFACATTISSVPKADQPVAIPANPQQTGDASKGYYYLITGDYIKSGVPYNIYQKGQKFQPSKPSLNRSGPNAAIPYDFTYIKAANGAELVVPNCLFCHAQTWGDSVVVGLGNSLSDYTMPQDASLKMSELALNVLASDEEKAAGANLIRSGKAAFPYLVTATKGVNIADKLTAVLAAHRDPKSFVWNDKPSIKIPEEVIPTDVPAWWLLKKKNAMFYNGFGRGDFSRFLMAANLLTVTDTSEANEVLSHFDDVLAYLYSIEPPKYPGAFDEAKALQGKKLFENNCSKCHGTYGEKEEYPNLLIPSHIIKTDSALLTSNFSSKPFLNWFEKSWFKLGERPASLQPFHGYIAPPLDGVWITAPYLHNGSVPDLYTLLNSKARPTFWERNFDQPVYDYQKVGWQYATKDKQYTRSTYNTTLKGYGNNGHYFGDKLSDDERWAVIEYLKTL